jgi:hypothetical protein
MIADTDHGWYSWSVSGVPLTKRIRDDGRGSRASVVASDPFAVLFPIDLIVRHAWVARAKTTGETFFGWDAKGAHDCDVPAYTTASAFTEPGGPPPQPPAPQKPAVTAKPTSAPFTAPACDKPFVAATVTKAVAPFFPYDARNITKPISSDVEVEVGADGLIIDAWTYESAGIPSVDKAALDAALASKYSAAVSYCRPVDSGYIFKADFNPD